MNWRALPPKPPQRKIDNRKELKMDMKRMMMALVAMLAGSVLAEVSVMDIKCTPRNPWNGLVDIEYTIATDNPDADVYVNPVAYDGDRRITLFPSSFSGDGATNTVKAGRHTMVWDAKKDFGTFSSANFQIKIYAGERLARYVMIDISGGNTAETYPVRLSHVGPDLSDDACRTTNLWLRLVPPGEFWMGSPADEVGRSDNEDLHHVTLTKPFYLGTFPVTVAQYKLIHGISKFDDTWSSTTQPPLTGYDSNSDCCPINNQPLVYNGVSSDVSSVMRGLFSPTSDSGFPPGSFVAKIRKHVPNVGFDFPSETRWEYACRAGTTTALSNGKNLSDTILSQPLGEIAAYYGNRNNGAELKTIAVGSYRPNALGLYDMLGNIWEACRDGGVNNEHLGFEDVVDPAPWGTYAVKNGDYYDYCYIIRGGQWSEFASKCRSASRSTYRAYNTNKGRSISNNVGFRICAEAGF